MPGTSTLFSGCYGINTDAVKMWDLNTDSYKAVQVHGGGIAMASGNSGKYFAIGSSRGTIALYNMEKGDGLWFYKTGRQETISSIGLFTG